MLGAQRVPAAWTQALRQRRHWPIATSTIDWTKRPLSLIRRISNSLTLVIVVNFLLQWAYTPDAIVFRSDEFGSHSVGEMMSGTFCFRKVTVSRARCASASSC